MISKTCQPGCEAVQTKPAFRRESNEIVLDICPSLILPRSSQLQIRFSRIVAVDCPQTKIDFFGTPIVVSEQLLTFLYTFTLRKSRLPGRIRRNVPSPRQSVERMSRRTGANIIDSAPIGGIMSRSLSRTREVRDFVVLKSGRSRGFVRFEKLFGVPLFGGRNDLTPRLPSPKRSPLLYGQPI